MSECVGRSDANAEVDIFGADAGLTPGALGLIPHQQLLHALVTRLHTLAAADEAFNRLPFAQAAIRSGLALLIIHRTLFRLLRLALPHDGLDRQYAVVHETADLLPLEKCGPAPARLRVSEAMTAALGATGVVVGRMQRRQTEAAIDAAVVRLALVRQTEEQSDIAVEADRSQLQLPAVTVAVEHGRTLKALLLFATP